MYPPVGNTYGSFDSSSASIAALPLASSSLFMFPNMWKRGYFFLTSATFIPACASMGQEPVMPASMNFGISRRKGRADQAIASLGARIYFHPGATSHSASTFRKRNAGLFRLQPSGHHQVGPNEGLGKPAGLSISHHSIKREESCEQVLEDVSVVTTSPSCRRHKSQDTTGLD